MPAGDLSPDLTNCYWQSGSGEKKVGFWRHKVLLLSEHRCKKMSLDIPLQ